MNPERQPLPGKSPEGWTPHGAIVFIEDRYGHWAKALIEPQFYIRLINAPPPYFDAVLQQTPMVVLQGNVQAESDGRVDFREILGIYDTRIVNKFQS